MRLVREVGAGKGAWIINADTGEWVALACGDSNESAERHAAMIVTTGELLALARRVANLNRDAGEIGAGMLAQLVDEAGRLTQRAEGG